MDNRLPSGTSQRPPLLQRAVSGGSVLFPPRPRNPYLQSPLGNGRSNVRSVSQPTAAVDLTLDDEEDDDADHDAFAGAGHTPSSSIVLDDDAAEQPPAKRAKTTGDAFRAKADRADVAPDRAHIVVPGSPLPALPAPSEALPPPQGLTGKRHRARGGPAARSSQANDPPLIAVRVPPPKNVADFSPWSGHHPEDIMNETAVKSGYFDKGASQNECNSARPSIWPNLSQKNHMGLQTLSYLFAQVMEKRQALGKCTSASTFKPPPRVTVTDTKREAWLRDLANPDIPLRKQSRTIPHGIRGKVLLEQCLGKDIPLPRAVWLAKCVGANELRAFRRKGVSGTAAASGEHKWVREWTVAVEHFTEGVVSSCGQPEWQSRMNYSIRLLTQFYSERLLDMDHFLDWIVSSLADAVSERLPIWILITQLFWNDLTRFVRRGRRVALAVLDRLNTVTLNDPKAQRTVGQRLQKLVVALALSNRACLVIPSKWAQHRHLLTSIEVPPQHRTHLEDVRLRNERLIGTTTRTPQSSKPSMFSLYATLDSSHLACDSANLAQQCLAALPDTVQLVSALLQWAATPYRSGTARIYLVASIVGLLHRLGHNTDHAVLAFLEQSITVSAENVYSVIAHLIVTKTFSVGAYLQRLITRASNTADAGSLMHGLLTALPVDQLAIHTRNLRKTLLERHDLQDSPSSAIDGLLAQLDDDLVNSNVNKPATDLPSISLCLSGKFAVRSGIRDRLLSRKSKVPDLATFCTLRAWILHLQDIPLLADLLSHAVQSDDSLVLATMADTANVHAHSLAAIDRLSHLSAQLSEKYRALRSQQPLERTSIVALLSLFQRLPGHEAILKVLENDLPICDQQSTSAACSPASDNLIGVQSNGLESENDIDAVFASGNTMDQQLMERIFAHIIGMAQQKDGAFAWRVCSWLRQLKCFEPTTFEQIATRYVEQEITNAASRGVAGLSFLIASGCLALESYVKLAEQSATPAAAAAATRAIFCVDASLTSLRVDEAFRYRLLASRFADEHSTRVVQLILTAFEVQQEDAVINRVTDFLVKHASVSPEATDIIAGWKSQSDPLYNNATRLFVHLTRRTVPSSATTDVDAETVLQLAQPLSVSICVTALKFFSKFARFQRENTEDIVQQRLEKAISHGEEIWPKMVEVASHEGKTRLHDWAQDKLLFAPAAASDAGHTDLIDRCLEVMNLTRGALNKTDNQAVSSALVDKLREMDRRLSSKEQRDDALRYLRVLLHIAALTIKSEPADEADNAGQADGMLMGALCSLLVHPNLQSCREVLDCIFDLASVLYDGLPETVAASISKSLLNAKSVAPAILSIVGDVTYENPDTRLALSSQVRPPGSQAQQALARHASLSGQPTPRAPAPTSGQNTGGQRNVFGQTTTNRAPIDVKLTPYPLRRWELMPDATPSMGENDASLSLSLFGARKV